MAEKETSGKAGLAGAATAVLAGKGVAPRLLGYHNVYHGTTKPAAEAIRKHGFDPKKGGTGASAPTVNKKGVHSNPDFFERSKGKIHTTKQRPIAHAYAAFTGIKHKSKSEVIKARVTHQHFRNMKGDPDMSPNGAKNIAATTHHKIPSSQIKGGAGDKGIKGVVTKKTLKKYYRSGSGLARAARGVALAGIAAKGAHTAYSAVKSKLEKKAMDKDTRNGVIGGVGAVALAPHASRRLLGYHVVRHGTGNRNAGMIKEKGLDPKRGGRGGAGQHAAGTEDRGKAFRKQSRGKVHVTKNPLVSRMFASLTESRNPASNLKDVFKGQTIKARVTDRHWKGMKNDPHVRKSSKFTAATTHHRIKPEAIIGSRHSKGLGAVVNRNTLRAYYRNPANHNRIGVGAILGSAVAGGIYDAAKAIKHKLEKKASLIDLARNYLEA